jgi:hypothetical protein
MAATKNPPQDIANFFATSGWTVQANVNANDPVQPDASSTGPQAVFSSKFSAIESTDPYASVVEDRPGAGRSPSPS